jgi:TfoX/Sxy family transcriptional regulator of competence genes
VAYDETLADRVRALLKQKSGYAEKKMFGGLCFLLNGNMCCGVLKNELVLRLGTERAAQILKQPHTRPMDFTGRPMKGFLFVEPSGLASDEQLRRWVSESVQHALSLPAKIKSAGANRQIASAGTQRPRRKRSAT